jgi:Peptidase family M28
MKRAGRECLKGLALCLLFPPLFGAVLFDRLPRTTIEARLKQYAGNDQQREATLMGLFREAGCDGTNLSESPVKGSKLPNVVCVLPGSGTGTIIVGAHYDHIVAGQGVVDNWSGASLLPSLYESIKSNPRQHTFIFIGFCDEEKGEIGSRFYATHLTKEQVATTDAMVNMDTLGLAPTEVWASQADRTLYGLLARVAGSMKLALSGVNVEQVGSTDSVQFAERKIPSITIHSLTQKTWNDRILHTSKDTIEQIRLDDYYDTYRLVSAYIAYLDELPPRSAGQPSGKSSN